MSFGEQDQLIHRGVTRYLTEGLPGTGGSIKGGVEDFVVEELPLYGPSGEGTHTFFEIEKEGISTFQAIRSVANALGVSPNRIGYAGLKDAQAIACQVLSVEGPPPEAVMALDLPGIRLRWAERHRNKLKIGHLRGNRFTIRIADVDESALPNGQRILAVLTERGVPNRYGLQRFGQRGDSAVLGKAAVLGDAQAFIEQLLGGPHPNESEQAQAGRALFDARRWEEALEYFPYAMADERRALQVLISSQGDYRLAYHSVPKRLKVFLVSAYQSALFNAVLDARLQTLDCVFEGDLAMKHPGRSVFYVEDATAEQPRAGRFEISPTGPIFGYKMIQPTGEQAELEAAVLAAEGLVLEDFRVGDGLKAKGGRRALRFPVHEPELWYDQGLVLRFWLW
ncbi:MAG: tRNA pseudouridine(13) synthase TruD, partial [Anaerolineae bacterium]|nr:tRNA pseudouridine(13) synthase TruD [Anaerolineae bacterium]